VEETQCCVLDLLLVDTPSLTKITEDISLEVEHLNSALLGNILHTHDTIADSGGFQESEPANFASVVGVSTTARLYINTLDLDDAKRVSRHNTTLVKAETMLTLGLSLFHEALADVVTIVDHTVGSVLDLLLLSASQRLEVSNVDMSLPLRLLRTSLPDVGAEHLTARSEDDMGASVMSLKLEATDWVN